jgi:dimethylargininase
MYDRRALVRRPSSRLAEGLVTHIERQRVDVDLAVRQWEGYVEALQSAGWETIEVPLAEDCPDSVFVEDTVVMYGDRAVITRPGADERKPETGPVADLLGALGYDVVSIEAPGTLDGGDVLKHDDTVWVGLGGRTNASGIEQLTAYLEPYGAQVVPVPLSKVLLGDNRFLMSADAPESERLFAERGLDVVAVDIGEFIKLEGCVTCLSVRLRHTP